MNKPLDKTLDKTRMNKMMVTKKSRLSARGCLQVAVLGVALTALLPIQVYSENGVLITPVEPVLGVAPDESVIVATPATQNLNTEKANQTRNKKIAAKATPPKNAAPKKSST
ncbi:MAG: hypothetical protein Q8Q57_09680, partial [Methylotenera sp.]|nr:hypothetical protein [Methylotenera sp.]